MSYSNLKVLLLYRVEDLYQKEYKLLGDTHTHTHPTCPWLHVTKYLIQRGLNNKGPHLFFLTKNLGGENFRMAQCLFFFLLDHPLSPCKSLDDWGSSKHYTSQDGVTSRKERAKETPAFPEAPG